jgi:hypothetical protein
VYGWKLFVTRSSLNSGVWLEILNVSFTFLLYLYQSEKDIKLRGRGKAGRNSGLSFLSLLHFPTRTAGAVFELDAQGDQFIADGVRGLKNVPDTFSPLA